jgi:hypothetical protein
MVHPAVNDDNLTVEAMDDETDLAASMLVL